MLLWTVKFASNPIGTSKQELKYSIIDVSNYAVLLAYTHDSIVPNCHRSQLILTFTL